MNGARVYQTAAVFTANCLYTHARAQAQLAQQLRDWPEVARSSRHTYKKTTRDNQQNRDSIHITQIAITGVRVASDAGRAGAPSSALVKRARAIARICRSDTQRVLGFLSAPAEHK